MLRLMHSYAVNYAANYIHFNRASRQKMTIYLRREKKLGFCLDFRFKMNLFDPYNVAINNRTSKTGKMILN